MAPTATALPHPEGPLWISDGGLETSLVFRQGIDLPDFAAFPLLADQAGRQALADYYRPYLGIASRHGVGVVLDTPTWRASSDWGARRGWTDQQLEETNRGSVGFIRQLSSDHGVHALHNGVIGPRGDGYRVGYAMSAGESARYHAPQARAFAEAGADMVSALTMNYLEEAVGIADAAAAVGLPTVISFTVETDGQLPSGQALGDAIEAVDALTSTAPSYFMINCAHPAHFHDVLDADAGWLARIGGVRANASELSHAELDEAEVLHRGDPAALAAHYRLLASVLPALRVIGGCCGTDEEHIAAMAAAVLAPRDRPADRAAKVAPAPLRPAYHRPTG